MPARQARRPRRSVASTPLPRPSATDDTLPEPVHAPAAAAAPSSRATRRQLGVRAHHVQEDYRYVRRELVLVAAVAAVAMGFVVGMSFVF